MKECVLHFFFLTCGSRKLPFALVIPGEHLGRADEKHPSNKRRKEASWQEFRGPESSFSGPCGGQVGSSEAEPSSLLTW